MKQKLLNSIIVLAFVSLLGVVFMQVYWVRNAYELKEEHFNHSVRLSMKTVLNRLLEIHTDSTLKQLTSPDPCIIKKTEVTDVIQPQVLDSLIKAELGCMQITDGYEYGIYNRNTLRFSMGNYQKYKPELLLSVHQQSIEALFSPGDYFFSIYFPRQQNYLMRQLIGWMAISAVFLLIIIFSFWFTIVTILRQKKVSEMKNDFINNMTHEFKTPIATISLASEMLMKPAVQQDQTKTSRYAKVINQENARLQNQVEQLLQIAIIEKGELKLNLKTIEMHKLLQNTIDRFELKLQEKQGQIIYRPEATKDLVTADQQQMAHVFVNLIDNAIKYSPSKPEIIIATSNHQAGFEVRISDKGIGISRENHAQVFKNLYRVHTGDVHDVKGFGIGLYYVKRMLGMHHGSIELDSELGKGTTFTVFLPFEQSKNE
jgi:two-component system phosphate regulon sensor histidine kinase PhoR